MTRTEHLIMCLAEECAEVQKVASKVNRFGMEEVYSAYGITNNERLAIEFAELMAVAEMLEEQGFKPLSGDRLEKTKENKKKCVEQYLNYAKEIGALI
ncbi:MAG: hypothetical protein KAJ10_13540 [Thermodesulfovibrionia bacterium]|nr:hypothetical protein [Thermodesulfovibrionia bacterium]